jgi:hypothetical protein
MSGFKKLGALAGLALAGCLPAIAQDPGNWRAVSTTARSITGDIYITDDKLMINFTSFTIAQIRHLQATEINATFNADTDTPGGNLYRLSIPAAKHFLHRNALCSAEDTQWMATYVSGKTLQVAFFSGNSIPVFTPEALATTTNLCGTFTYGR